MKPFNLEEAKAGKKVVTRDGIEVAQLTEFNGIGDFCLFGVVNGVLKSWNKRGEEWRNNKSSNDLFMATEKKTVYIGVYKPFNPNGYIKLLVSHGQYSRSEVSTLYQGSGTLIEVIEREVEL